MELRRLDGVERLVCGACGFVFYQNPKPCVGGLIVDGGKLLLAKRGIEPFLGYWDIPGGFLEDGEHPEAGLIREMQEETHLLVEPVELLGMYMDVYSTTGDSTLNICYIARRVSGKAQSASDVVDLHWFDIAHLPKQIAFDWSMDALQQLQQRYDT
ncbi:MAG: NUDIX hydrolase [Okeania sp. SIO3B3]|nr:NUDIX hydrolase [Okeania sp. SIO3B3]